MILWIPICSTEPFSQSSLVFRFKINAINCFEAKPLELSDWIMTFLWQDDSLELNQNLTGLQLSPAHDPVQSIHWLQKQQINIQIHWLTHNLPTSSPKSQQTHSVFTIIINLFLLISHLHFFVLLWIHINDGWIHLHWQHYLFYIRKFYIGMYMMRSIVWDRIW